MIDLWLTVAAVAIVLGLVVLVADVGARIGRAAADLVGRRR